MMRKLIMFAVLLLVAVSANGQGVPTGKSTGQVLSTSSVELLKQDDLGMGLRDYLLIQCTGSNACYCCIGTNNGCTSTNGVLLAANGGSWTLVPQFRSNGVVAAVPVGDVACLSQTGSSVAAAFDY